MRRVGYKVTLNLEIRKLDNEQLRGTYRKAFMSALACTPLVLVSSFVKYTDLPFLRCRILLAIREIRIIWRVRREYIRNW